LFFGTRLANNVTAGVYACGMAFPEAILRGLTTDYVDYRPVRVRKTEEAISLWIAIPSVAMSSPASETSASCKAPYTVRGRVTVLSPMNPG